VVTNAHVIQGGNVQVESWEGRSVQASLVKIDRRRDLALLTAPGLNAPPAQLGDSDRVQVGTPILAVGNPLGFVGAVSTGIVHSIGPIRQFGPVAQFDGSSWIQADVRLAPGNSGGPLADLQGRVIGINTMIISGGLALAIPSRAVQTFLSRRESPRTLGIVVRPVRLRSAALGIMILELTPGGAAERASLLPGDILVAANDRPFRFIDDLQTAIEQSGESPLSLNFYRGGQDRIRNVVARLLPEQVMNAA
jgi:serine protease Do